MKLALAVLHHEVFGGPHNQILRLRNHLRAAGWETVVVLPDSPGNAAERLRAAGIRVIRIPLHRPRRNLSPKPHWDLVAGLLPEIASLRRIIREHRPDLVQVFGPIYPHGAVAARLEKTPVVWQLLGTFAPFAIRSVFMPAVLSLSDVVMTTGRVTARRHPGATRLRHRLVPFYPPVETQEFRPDALRRKRAREELGIPPEGFLIGTVGNLNRIKGHDLFVRAAALVGQMRPNVFFRILGTPTPTQVRYYDQHVISAAARLGLLKMNRLEFVEPESRVAELLPAFDIFVLTSRSEGVPTSLLEAMACGIPVASTDVGAVREVVEDRITGRIIASRTEDAVARAIFDFLDNPSARTEMAVRARAVAIERFDTRVCVETHLRAYELACCRQRQRQPGSYFVKAT